jgi:hypothetical protein
MGAIDSKEIYVGAVDSEEIYRRTARAKRAEFVTAPQQSGLAGIAGCPQETATHEWV